MLPNIDKLRDKVIQEFSQGTEHIRERRDAKRDQLAKLLQRPEKGKIKVHKVWKNLNLRKALFLRDEEDVKIVQDSGPIGQMIAEKANKVIKFDSIDMNMREDKEQLITDDAMFGLGAVMIDGYDEIEQQPIRTIVNPLTCYGDPRAWNTSKMTYFGTEVYKSKYELEESEAFFNVDKIEEEYSQAMEDFERARNTANSTQYFTSEAINEYKTSNRVSLVNHITTFEGKLYLTSWTATLQTCCRVLELRDLSNRERRRPDKIDLGVTLYRAKPIPYSFFGASLFDEVEQYQDLATLLVHLQVEQAKRNALGPNKYVDSRLGIDLDQIQNKPLSGGIIEYTPDLGQGEINANNGIIQEPKEPVSQFPQQILQMNDSLMDETLGYNSQQVFGVSQGGSQTKAEVQTLQQNINEQLGLIADNYLESSKQYWKDHITCYASNMGEKDKKSITLFTDEKYDSYTLKKADFVPNGRIQVFITSKVQQDIRDKQDFPVVQVIYGQIAQNLEQGSGKFNELTRKLIDKGGVEGLRGLDLFPYNKDERKAIELVEIINRDEYKKDVYGPEKEDDLEFIIEKIDFAIDNKSKTLALLHYEDMRDKVASVKPEVGATAETDAMSTSMGANMLASQQQQNPNIGQVQA